MAKRITIILLFIALTGCFKTSVKEVKNLLEQQIEADNYYAQNQCDEALPLYKELVEALPKNTNNLVRIGNCYAKKMDYNQAEQAYMAALERDPSFVKAWYNLSYIKAKILANTVSEMHKNVEPSSPEAEKIRQLTLDVLAPFNLELDL